MAQMVRHCVHHPRRETRVSCAACGEPICTACMRETPVGMKCPSCSRVSLHARALGTPKQYVTAT
ncbi:MAG TPA: rhomboid family intramembrane serine protease, partial [Actinomycetota bacterium]